MPTSNAMQCDAQSGTSSTEYDFQEMALVVRYLRWPDGATARQTLLTPCSDLTTAELVADGVQPQSASYPTSLRLPRPAPLDKDVWILLQDAGAVGCEFGGPVWLRNQVLNAAVTTRTAEDAAWWVFADEFTPRGGFADATPPVPDRPASWGVPIDGEAAAAVSAAADKLRALDEWVQAQVDPARPALQPLALYHGTSYRGMDGIMHGGFEEAFGMLGVGVYAGTFWKACRFAGRDAEYAVRRAGDAGLLQLLAWPRRGLRELTADSPPCRCSKCVAAASVSAGGTASAAAAARFVDHEAVWRREGRDGCHVAPCATGAAEDAGVPRHVVKNEEWVFDKAAVRVAAAALLDTATLTPDRHDPLQRDQRIV